MSRNGATTSSTSLVQLVASGRSTGDLMMLRLGHMLIRRFRADGSASSPERGRAGVGAAGGTCDRCGRPIVLAGGIA